MSSILSVPQTYLKLRKLLKFLQGDIIHTWLYHANLLGGIAVRQKWMFMPMLLYFFFLFMRINFTYRVYGLHRVK